MRKCAYCGLEEDPTRNLRIWDCPVCGTLFCEICGATLQFMDLEEKANKSKKDEDDIPVVVWQGKVCKVHVPWNIIEGIKRRAKEKNVE